MKEMKKIGNMEYMMNEKTEEEKKWSKRKNRIFDEWKTSEGTVKK